MRLHPTIAALGIALATLISATTACADEVGDRITAALAHPDRAQAERERDPFRMPVEVIDFVGIETGMSVIDVAAYGGWYTEVLAAAVGPEGRVVAQNAVRTAERSAALLEAKQARYPNIEILAVDYADGFGMDGQFDAAWTALNLHDFANRDRAAGIEYLQAIYDSLKPGGVLGFIDHEGSAEYDNARLHRIEKATARELLQEVGFVIEAESDLLDNPDDTHDLGVREDSLRYATDRMLFRVRKPAE